MSYQFERGQGARALWRKHQSHANEKPIVNPIAMIQYPVIAPEDNAMEFPIRTELACRIAGVDRLKFNEAVSRGTYPAAPPTAKGSTRKFDESELIALYVFGRALNISISASQAGQLASACLAFLRQGQIKYRFQLLRYSDGSTMFISDQNFRPAMESVNGKTIDLVLEFRIKAIRRNVCDAVAREQTNFGEEE